MDIIRNTRTADGSTVTTSEDYVAHAKQTVFIVKNYATKVSMKTGSAKTAKEVHDEFVRDNNRWAARRGIRR